MSDASDQGGPPEEAGRQRDGLDDIFDEFDGQNGNTPRPSEPEPPEIDDEEGELTGLPLDDAADTSGGLAPTGEDAPELEADDVLGLSEADEPEGPDYRTPEGPEVASVPAAEPAGDPFAQPTRTHEGDEGLGMPDAQPLDRNGGGEEQPARDEDVFGDDALAGGEPSEIALEPSGDAPAEPDLPSSFDNPPPPKRRGRVAGMLPWSRRSKTSAEEIGALIEADDLPEEGIETEPEAGAEADLPSRSDPEVEPAEEESEEEAEMPKRRKKRGFLGRGGRKPDKDGSEEENGEDIAAADPDPDLGSGSEPVDAETDEEQESPKKKKKAKRSGRSRKGKPDASEDGEESPARRAAAQRPDEGFGASGGEESRKERQQRRKAERKADREAIRDAKVSDKMLRRQAKRLKAPKEAKEGKQGKEAASDKKKQPKVKVEKRDKKKQSKPKLTSAERKQARIKRKADARFSPPKGNKKATVLVVDGSHVTIVAMRGGRVVGVTEQEYEHDDIAVAAATKQKQRAARLVWGNAAGMRSMPNRANEAGIAREGTPTFLKDLREADALMSAFANYPDQKLMSPLSMEPPPPPHRSNALSVPNEFANHRLFIRHQGRTVTSGQCHGQDAGVWLRLGYYATELTHVIEGGYTLSWGAMPPLDFPPPVAGGEPPDYGSGVDALSKACAAKSDKEGIAQYIEAVVSHVDKMMRQWGSTAGAGVIDVLWVHGPGVSTPGLLDALSEKLKMRVVRPHVEVAPSVVDIDQATVALNAWSHKPFRDPRKIIAKARRGRRMRQLRRGGYVAAGIFLIVAAAAWQGRGRHIRIEEAQARTDQANSDLAAAQSAAPPDVSFGAAGALDWLGCPLPAVEAGSAAGQGSPVAATPVGYDPANWPDGWDAVIDLATVEDEQIEALSQHVTVGRIALAQEIAGAQRLAERFRNGDIIDEAGDGIHDDIDAAFDEAGLDRHAWRVFSWAHLHFGAADGQFFVPPRTVHMCAAAGPDLLWKAQNEPMLPAMFVRQMTTYPEWGITAPSNDLTESVSLSQDHSTYTFEDMTVFTAWIVHHQDVAEVLQPLVFQMWGNAGETRVTDPLVRQCRTGLHPATGRPLDQCGSTTSVLIGPRHLVAPEEQQAPQ